MSYRKNNRKELQERSTGKEYRKKVQKRKQRNLEVTNCDLKSSLITGRVE